LKAGHGAIFLCCASAQIWASLTCPRFPRGTRAVGIDQDFRNAVLPEKNLRLFRSDRIEKDLPAVMIEDCPELLAS
jgi:hypothetical protein